MVRVAGGHAMAKAALIVTSLMLASLSVAFPAQAVCTSVEMILDEGGCGGGDGGGCITYKETGSSGQDTAHRTECSDGFRCTGNHHHNDPNESPSTTYDPPGCENDPRYGS